MAEWSVLVFFTADSPFTFNRGVAGFICRETVADTMHLLPLDVFSVHLYLCSNYQHTPFCPEHSHQHTHFCSFPCAPPRKLKWEEEKTENHQNSDVFFLLCFEIYRTGWCLSLAQTSLSKRLWCDGSGPDMGLNWASHESNVLLVIYML